MKVMHGLHDEFRDIMMAAAAALDHEFNPPASPRTTGFVLVVFPLNRAAGRQVACSVISNASQESVTAVCRHYVEHCDSDSIEVLDGEPKGRA